MKFWWLLFQVLPEKKFDLIWFKLLFALIFFWLALMITIYMLKFWNFTMKLFHLLGFTKQLVFGSPTSVTRINLFLGFFRWLSLFKEPAGIACSAFEAFSRACIFLEEEMITFLSIFLQNFLKSNRIYSPFKNVLSLFLKSANKKRWHFTCLHKY